jgi:threonine dehydrogenase-like Zn-dependent dehydrogenase
MKAITVVPGEPGSTSLDEVDEPAADQGAILAESLAYGICGTDLEIAGGEYGWAPPGKERLTLGHESLGRVLEAPAGAGVAEGDLVVGIVRRPDPVPCPCCAHGEWDMCRNGEYTERGIKAIDGYASERFRVEPEFAIRLDPALERNGVLLEPASVLAKAWEQIDRIGTRACFAPKAALITGAGPIGLLAALMGVQRGLVIHVLDRVTEGVKPELVADLGATYHSSVDDAPRDVDVIVECTGVGQLVFDAMQGTAPGGIVCLTGVSPTGRKLEVDAGAINRDLVLQNDVVFGSVNAARRHYEQAAEALAQADDEWLERLITRRVPLDSWEEGFDRRDDDVKVVIDFTL